MSLQDDFTGATTVCMNPTFAFPPITSPGLPNFALGCFKATLAGINYVLDYIPPTIDNPPSLPSVTLFLDAFMGAVLLPPAYPGITLGPLTIPGVGSPPYAYDVGAEIKLIAVCVVLPFTLIKNMITKLLELTIELPTLDGIKAIFLSLCADVGLSGVSITKLAGCLAQSIFDLFGALV